MYEWAVNALQTWASFYANHATIRTLVGFLHVGGLLASGGCAIAADRMTLLSKREPLAARMAQLKALRGTHRIVIVGLVLVVISGLLLFAADTDTYLHSILFWTKMALVVVLLINGSLLVRAEGQAEAGNPKGWRLLNATAIASIALWFLTTLIGTALPNIS
jgi:uncharacterized membrane protein